MGCGSSSQTDCGEHAHNGVSKQVSATGETKKEPHRNGNVSMSAQRKDSGVLNNNLTKTQADRVDLEEEEKDELKISVSCVLCVLFCPGGVGGQ